MKKNEQVMTNNNTLLNFIKGLFIALIVTLVGILVFALIVKTLGVSENLIKPINQIIKFLSILIGVSSMFKSMPKKSLLNAILLGAIYTILAIILFNLLNGSFNFNVTMLTDATFGAIAGFISGVIAKLFAKN